MAYLAAVLGLAIRKIVGWAMGEEARRDIFEYIESYHNRRRNHSALGYRNPEQAERQVAQTRVHVTGHHQVFMPLTQ